MPLFQKLIAECDLCENQIEIAESGQVEEFEWVKFSVRERDKYVCSCCAEEIVKGAKKTQQK